MSVSRIGWGIGLAVGLVLAGCGGGADPEEDDGGIDVDEDADGGVDVDEDADGVPADDSGEVAEDAVADEATGGDEASGECDHDEDCADDLFCNGEERCVDRVCVAGDDPCDDGIDCTFEMCDEDEGLCDYLDDPAACDDGLLCNGLEMCEPFVGCVDGEPPDCDDGDPCTRDSCEDEMGGCVFAEIDDDLDGHMTMEFGCDELGGDDCDDGDGTIFPGAEEICDDGIDNDCDDLIDDGDDACGVGNDRCPGAVELEDGVPMLGGALGAMPDYDLGCAPILGPDVVYTFTLAETRDVTISYESLTGGLMTVLDLQEVCGVPGSSVRCVELMEPMGGRLGARSLDAGTYFVIVAVDGEWEEFEITLTTSPPSPPPENDTCAGAEDIPAGGGSVSGTLFGLSDDYTVATCSWGPDGVDAFYRLVLTEPHAVDLMFRTDTPPMWTTTMAILTVCGDSDSEIACATSPEPVIHDDFLPAGTYYVVIDSDYESDFTLEAVLLPPVYPPVNDQCAGAIDIPETGATETVSLVSAADDYAAGCALSGYPDAFYRLVLTEPHSVGITASGSYSAWVALMTECGVAATEIGCARGTLTRHFLDAGTYYIVVDAPATSISLAVTVGAAIPPPANDRCPGAIDISAEGMFSTSFEFANRDYPPSCSSSTTDTDVVYTFTTTERRDVTLTLSPLASTTSLTLAVRTDCADRFSEIACATGRPASRVLRDLPAGTYWVVVSGPSSVTGAVLEMTTAPPTPVPAGDVCSGAIDISGGGFFDGTFTGMSRDGYVSCSRSPSDVDVVYTFTTTAVQDVSLSVGALASTSTLYLAVRGDCADGGGDFACASGRPAVTTLRSLPAGTYHVIVSGPSSVSRFLIELALDPPTTACAGAAVIDVVYPSAGSTFSATESGTTVGATAAFDGSCTGYAPSDDVPYELVIHETSLVSAEVTAASFNTTLHLRGTCDYPMTEIACDNDGGTGTLSRLPPSTGTMTLEPGTYVLVVDGYSGTEGTYTLQVDAARP